MAGKIGAALFQLSGIMTVVGLVLIRRPDVFAWFGRLTGDIMTEHVIAPFTSMLVISAGLSALSWILSTLSRIVR